MSVYKPTLFSIQDIHKGESSSQKSTGYQRANTLNITFEKKN